MDFYRSPTWTNHRLWQAAPSGGHSNDDRSEAGSVIQLFTDTLWVKWFDQQLIWVIFVVWSSWWRLSCSDVGGEEEAPRLHWDASLVKVDVVMSLKLCGSKNSTRSSKVVFSTLEICDIESMQLLFCHLTFLFLLLLLLVVCLPVMCHSIYLTLLHLNMSCLWFCIFDYRFYSLLWGCKGKHLPRLSSVYYYCFYILSYIS